MPESSDLVFRRLFLRSFGEGLKKTQKINADGCKLLCFSGKCVIILPTVRDGGLRLRNLPAGSK